MFALFLLAACSKRASPSDAGTKPPVVVEVSGCDAWTADDVCEVSGEQDVRLLVKGDARPTIDGAAATIVGETIAGDARRFVVRVPPSARRLEVSSFVLHLAPSSRPSWWREATALRRAGKLDEASKIVEAHLGDAGANRARARGVAARIALARGKIDDAVALFESSIAGLSAAGRVSEEADDRFALSWLLSQRTAQLDRARAVLDEGASRLARFADGRARASYYRALIALAGGDVRAALRLLATARADAERLGLASDARDADETHANTLLEIGRADEARVRLDALDRASSDPPCRRSDLQVNLARATRQSSLPDAVAASARIFESALALVRSGCPGGLRAANILLELARTKHEAGEIEAAKKLLAESRAANPTPGAAIGLGQLDLEARIALSLGQVDAALALFSRTSTLASSSGNPEARFSAAVGRAEALEAKGKLEEARLAYLEAESILDDAALLVPIGERRGEDSVFERSAKGLVDLLVRMHREREAFEVVRAVRQRALRGLLAGSEVSGLDPERRQRWERAVAAYRLARRALEESAAKDWSVPESALAATRAERMQKEKAAREAFEEAMALLAKSRKQTTPPLVVESDAVVVAWHPAKKGLLLFAASAPLVRVARVDAPTDLAPLRDTIASAKRIRVLAHGPALSVDVHALPFDGAPLVAHAIVEYALDLPFSSKPASPTNALVVSDPEGNLEGARLEGDAVEKTLRDGGLEVARLHQRTANGAAIAAALPSVGLFHFAGHARAGDDPFDSALGLTDGGKLGVADVLALPSAPAVVVLSACEAARSRFGLGLAHAFVAAGANAAIAPWRPVRDALAADLGRAFHRELLVSHDAPAALRAAALDVRNRASTEDWQAFRAVVR